MTDRTITRRHALMGLAGAASLATISVAPVVAASADDKALLAAIERFEKAWSASEEAHAAYHARLGEVRARPDFPPRPDPYSTPLEEMRAANERERDFLNQHMEGFAPNYEDCTRLHRVARVALRTVFETPANTLPGLLAKLRIVQQGYGNGETPGDNGDIVSAQFGIDRDDDNPEDDREEDEDIWFLDVVVDDLERLVGEGRSHA